jgi:hypothetical protein
MLTTLVPTRFKLGQDRFKGQDLKTAEQMPTPQLKADTFQRSQNNARTGDFNAVQREFLEGATSIPEHLLQPLNKVFEPYGTVAFRQSPLRNEPDTIDYVLGIMSPTQAHQALKNGIAHRLKEMKASFELDFSLGNILDLPDTSAWKTLLTDQYAIFGGMGLDPTIANSHLGKWDSSKNQIRESNAIDWRHPVMPKHSIKDQITAIEAPREWLNSVIEVIVDQSGLAQVQSKNQAGTFTYSVVPNLYPSSDPHIQELEHPNMVREQALNHRRKLLRQHLTNGIFQTATEQDPQHWEVVLPPVKWEKRDGSVLVLPGVIH